MEYWSITAGSNRRRSLRRLGRLRNLPLSQCRPAFIVAAAQNGGITGRYAIFLRFIDNAFIERHRLWSRLIDAGIMNGAFIQDGDRENPRANDAGRVSCDLYHRGGPQLMRLAPLRKDGSDGCDTHQHENRAGQELSSAI